MQVHHDDGHVADGSSYDRKRQAPPVLHFTPTEAKVLHGVRYGRSNKQIAFDLGIAETTVKAHMTALMRKLNVCNRTQAALACNTPAMATFY